jgi:hypothetical protein
MLGNLKPVPRFIVLAAVVGGLGYAASTLDLKKFTASKPTEQVVEATPVPAAAEPAQAVAAQPAPQPVAAQPQPAAPAPALQPAATEDAGLAGVLAAGKKK